MLLNIIDLSAAFKGDYKDYITMQKNYIYWVKLKVLVKNVTIFW